MSLQIEAKRTLSMRGILSMKLLFGLSFSLVFPLFAPAMNSLTISGISSGGFMASQMATIYSDQFAGVATVAGGVFYCAENEFQSNIKKFGSQAYFSYGIDAKNVRKSFDIENILKQKELPQDTSQFVGPLAINPIYQSVGVCMAHPEGAHQAATLSDGVARPMDLSFMKAFESKNLIAPTSNIANQRVLIYQGQDDEVVRVGMAEKIKEFYTRYGVSENSLKVIIQSGNHNFPTDRTDGIDCQKAKVPYIGNCKLDLAGEILQHMLARPLVRGVMKPENLYRIVQKKAPPSIASYGYLYANEACLENPDSCDLHVALHGCQMSDSFDMDFQKWYQAKVLLTRVLGVPSFELGAKESKMGALTFATKSGYADYAEATENHVMILFPQTQITSENYPANPNGCWDWYGWTGGNYATKKGVESSWLMSYIQMARKNPKALILKDQPQFD